MEIEIREFQEIDAKAVAVVGKKSWFHTYGHIFPREYIEKRTSRSYNHKQIKKTAVDPDHTKMFVALVENKIVGFSQPSHYNYWDPDTFNPNKMMISRIYVLPKYMRKGIGSKLLERSERWIQNQGFDKYYLYVHKANSIGRNFYGKKGFEIIEGPNEDDEVLLLKHIK